jgi:hypothetical protein
MKKVDYDRHRFDGKIKIAIFFGLILLAFILQLFHSSLTNEVVVGILILAGVYRQTTE